MLIKKNLVVQHLRKLWFRSLKFSTALILEMVFCVLSYLNKHNVHLTQIVCTNGINLHKPTLISPTGDVISLTRPFLIKFPSSGRVVPTLPKGGSTSCRRYFLITLFPRAIWQKALRNGTISSCGGWLATLRRPSRIVNIVWTVSILYF